MIELLLTNWRMILIGVLAAAAALCFKLWREEARAFTAFRAAVIAEGKAQKEQYETTVKDVSVAWEKQLPLARSGAVAAYCRTHPCGVLPDCRSQVPEAGSSGTLDGASKERIVVSAGFISDCAEDALKVRSWQNWARENQLPVAGGSP